MLKFLRHIKLITIGLTATVAILFIILLSLITTEKGSRWLLQTAFSSIKQISTAEINGSIANSLTLKKLYYQQSSDFSISIKEFKLKWHSTELLKGHLHITLIQLDGIEIKGQPSGSQDKEDKSAVPEIPLSLNIDQLIINQLSWLNEGSKTELQQLLLTAQLKHNILKLSKLKLAMPPLQINAASEIQLQSDWPLTAELDWSYMMEASKLKGLFKVTGNMDQFDIYSTIKGAVVSEQQGFIKLSANQPEFSLSGHWNKLQWPLSGKAQVSSHKGDFQIQGSAQNYHAVLNGKAASNDATDFSFVFIGNGNQKSIDIERMQLNPVQGLLNLEGQVSWAQGVGFDLAVTSKNLNPADFGTDIPGEINLNAHGKGRFDKGKINATLDIKKIAGTIHDQPINANGKIKLAGKQIHFQKFQLSAGSNRLQASGQLTEQLANLKFTIAAPDLKTVWPRLTGNMNGYIQIKGSLLKPIVSGNIQGHSLSYQTNRIDSLSLQADYAHTSNKQSNMDFSVTDIQIGENKIKRITLKGYGNQKSHNVSFNMFSPIVNASINVDGEWNGKQWLGHIHDVTIDHPQLKKWQLQSAVNLMLSKTKENYDINLPTSCLVQNQAQLCLSAQGDPNKQLDGKLSFSSWPLALTKHWLPEELSLQGLVSANAIFSSHSKDLAAKASVNITKGMALLKKDENIIHKQAFTESVLQLQYQQDHLNSTLRLGLGKKDFITAEIITGPADNSGTRRLSGILKSNISDMTFADGLLPQINQLQGLFTADLKIAGDTHQPTVTGAAKLQNSQFEIPKLGTAFHNFNLRINSENSNSKRLQLNAKIESGEGQLIAKGHLDLQAEHNYPLSLALTGENFQISRLPEAEVIISPSLTIDKQDNLTKIDGLIKIDKAQIEIKTLPETAIAPSEDEAIITSDKPKQKTIDLSRLNTRISIHFGENSHFSGFGLKTRLAGKLHYISKQDKQRMQGHAEMKNASYRAYGQDLKIRKGEFVFNGPADNPWLNIEAIRKANTEDITAVLNVTGPLKNPKTRVFTEPALTESEALAYLVTGNSLKNMGKGGSGTVASAAFNYGAGQLSWLSDQLGIDEFEFKQGETIQDSAVQLGHYLNPDLYVGLTMGLFSNKYAANLRYRLSKHFSINTRAGETQRIDLKYHIEID